jgi:membrane associated rhomboid family serine protease
VTLLLIAANLLAAYGLLFDPYLAREFGFRADLPEVRDAFTSLFLHANVLHLLGNLVFLAAVGAAVEVASGSLRFAIVYFVAGLAGVGVHLLATHRLGSPFPLIGASGCVAGCAAYYSFRYTSQRISVVPRFALSVAAITGVWVVLQVAGAFIRIGESGGVSYWSHLGGFAAGILLSVIFRAPDAAQVQLDHALLDQMNARSPAAAFVAAQRHLEQHPGDRKALREAAEAQAALGDPQAEAKALVTWLGGSPDEGPEVLRRLAEIGHITELPTLRRLQLADRYPEVARVLLRSVVEGPVDDPQRPDALLAMAAHEESEEARQKWVDELVGRYPMHPATDVARKRGWA